MDNKIILVPSFVDIGRGLWTKEQHWGMWTSAELLLVFLPLSWADVSHVNALPSLENPRLRAASHGVARSTTHNESRFITLSAFEVLLRPSAASKVGDLENGSEEVWEHLIVHDSNSAATMGDTTFEAHEIRNVAHALEVPAAVHAWLDASEDELAKLGDRAAGKQPDDVETVGNSASHDFQDLPNFLSFVSRADATVALAPSASALSHLGTGPDVALVMGWPNRESFAAALAPEGPLALGLLRGLPPDNLLWDRLRQVADDNYAFEEDASKNGIRLRVAWQRSSTSNRGGDNVNGDIFEVSLEAAPTPAHGDTWQGTAGEWCAERARAWGSTLRSSNDAHPWLVLQPLRGAPRAMRLTKSADGKEVTASHAPLSAAEAASESESDTASRGLRLWFPTDQRSVQPDSISGTDETEGHRRLLGSYYRELCATDTESFSTLIPAGCSSWYQDASSPWCSSSFGGSCNFCSSTGAEAGYYFFNVYKSHCECPAGKYSSGGTTSCSNCPAGYYSSSAASACTQCSSGYYSLEGSSSCSVCPAGTQSSSGASACTTCDAGTYSSGGSSSVPSCTACPAGKYQGSSGMSVCLNCDAGYYCASGATAMTACSVGRYSSSSSSSCAGCPTGSYASSTGAFYCTQCGSGSYASASASTACVSCPSGQHQSAQGQTSCMSCLAGRYTSTAGSVACNDCAAGKYQSSSGSSACEDCSSGTYSEAAASSCISCSAGTYVSSTGKSTCSSCATGKYSGPGASSCTSCAVGRDASVASSASCSYCVAGKYADVTGLHACKSCPTGYYGTSTGAMACSTCGAGQFQNSQAQTSCKDCAAGKYSDVAATTCASCSKGQYSAASASSCTACDAGRVSTSEGATLCSSCITGTYSVSGASVCTSCPSGQYSASSGSLSCTDCPGGKAQSSSGQTSCTDCIAGTYASSAGRATSCTNCPKGYYSGDAALSCISCLAGYVTTTSGLSTCTPCSSGYYCGSGASTCLACPSGFYAAGTANTACTSCDKGTYSAAAASGCTDCSAGRYGAISASSSCSACSSGKYSTGGTSSCTACSVGKHASYDGSIECDDCIAGKYADLTSRSECTGCPGGQYNSATGQSYCIDCARGKYASDTGSTACVACLEGTTSNAGSSECDDGCHAGSYLYDYECYYCPKGQYSEKGATVCINCTLGFYAPDEGEIACTVCPAGYIANGVGLSTIEICPSGKYSGHGSTECTNCYGGYFSSAGSATCSDACQAGTYSGYDDLSCITCPAGYYSSEAAESCSQCPWGKHSSEEGSAECSYCDPGYGTGGGNANTKCNICSEGRASWGSVCYSCYYGYYNIGIGNTVCLTCPSGKFQDAQGQNSCKDCVSAKFAPSSATRFCTVCENGRYGPTTGLSDCMNCTAGQFAFSGASSCQNCPSGAYSFTGARSCRYCNSGRYSQSAGSPECTDCPEGRYSTSEGGFASCIGCPKGMFKNATGSTSCDSCAPGRYSSITGGALCNNCAAGYLCTEGSATPYEYDCVNTSVMHPENYYCPEGTGPRPNLVPDNYYSTPKGDVHDRNRKDIEKCPKISNCLYGIEYPGLLWLEGDCAEGTKEEGDGGNARTIILVDEAAPYVSVGLPQAVLSPYPVEFTLASSRNFDMMVYAGDGNETLATAQIFVNMSTGLDYETENSYQIALTATSNGSSINCTINIAVQDINEKPKIVFGTPSVRNVSEAAIVNDYLTGEPIRSEDPDAKDEHIYSIIASEPPEGMTYFGIGGCSGRLYVAAEGLDVVVQPQYNLTIRTKDDAVDSLQDHGNLTVNVLNANDAPYFLVTENEVHCAIREGTPINTSVTGTNCTGGFKWSDPDSKFGDSVTFSISRNDVDETFGIKPATGELFLRRGNALDYDIQSKYSLAIAITDIAGLSASLDIIIMVNDVNDAPTSEYPRVFVDENTAPGTEVLGASRVITTDPDSTRFKYSLLLDGNATNSNGTLYFNVTANDGSIVVGPAGLNYEKHSFFILTVITSDYGLNDCASTCPHDWLESYTRVLITINNLNEIPLLSVAESYLVPENAMTGSALGYLYVRDQDVGQRHTYSTSGADGDIFAVSSLSSTRAVLQVDSGLSDTDTEGLNFEKNPGPLSVFVTVSDGDLASTSNITIFVNNSNDAPVCPEGLPLTIDENEIGPLLLKDDDHASGRPVFNYTDEDDPLLAPTAWGEASLDISLQESGVVSVLATCVTSDCTSREANLTLQLALDYERTPLVTFLITVTDGGGLTCTTYATVYVGNVNEAPSFEPSQRNQTVYVSKASELGDAAGYVTAVDPDDSESTFGTLTYSLFYAADGLTQCEPDPTYTVDTYKTLSIDASTGELTVRNASSHALSGDRSFCAGVLVTDGGGLTATTTVNVFIAEKNFAPYLKGVVLRIPEHQASFTNLAILQGTDSDPGDDGVAYTLQTCAAGPNATLSCRGRADMFELITNASVSLTYAWLKLGESQLNYEDSVFKGLTPTYFLTVKLTDSYPLVPLTGYGLIKILVVDEPDYPTFENSAFSVNEAQDGGATVGELASYAADEDEGAIITFSLDDLILFRSAAMTWKNCWSSCARDGLQMACIDSKAKQKKLLAAYNGSYSNIWMGLRDTDDDGLFVWDNVPGCDPHLQGYSDWKSGQPGTSTTQNCALLDATTGLWDTAKCSSTPAVGATACACEQGPFNVSSAGSVTTTGVLNYEILENYVLQVVATDDTGLQAFTTTAVTVKDVDEAPVVPSGQHFSVSESVSRGTTIGGIVASDEDIGDIISYTLLNGTDKFTLTLDDGDLLVGGNGATALLDFECANQYVLAISAEDLTGLITTALVTVDVKDDDDATIDSISTYANLTMPTSSTNDFLFHSSSDLDCVCEAYGLLYADGGATYSTVDVCYLNYGSDGAACSSSTYLSYLCDSATSVSMPVVASVVCTNPDALPTLGGASGLANHNGIVVLSGTNFGPCGGSQSSGAVKVAANYTNGLDGLTYTATECAVQPGSNTEIRCLAAPGVGTGHTWTVIVDASTAHFNGGNAPGGPWATISSVTTSYEPPTVVNITGATDMNTDGGAVVTLSGFGMPPYTCKSLAVCGGDTHMYALSGPAVGVTFQFIGNGVSSVGGSADSSATYTCLNLEVTQAGTQVTCTVPTGVGTSLWWSAEVGAAGIAAVAQSSTLEQFYGTGYGAPTIDSLAENYDADYAALGLNGIYDLATSGGDFVLITGRNFGPNFADILNSAASRNAAPAVQVTYGPVTGGPWDYNEETNDGGIFKYTATDCSVFTSNTEVLCTVAPGVGANLTWRVLIGGQAGSSLCADLNDDGLNNRCAYNLSTSYAPPSVEPMGASSSNAVSGAGLLGGTTVGGQQLVITGNSFGPSEGEAAPRVTYGPPGEEDRYAASFCEVSVDFSQISCLTTEGVGTDHSLAVFVGGQKSNVYSANISYSPPNVASYLASWDKDEASSSGSGASTRGGEWVVLEGRNFGTAAESRIKSVSYEAAGDGSAYQKILHSCQKVTNPRATTTSAFVGAPTKDGYYFHASTTPACVCGTYGYDYKNGAVEYATTQVCFINYGCDYLKDMGCGNSENIIASVECSVPDTTLRPFYDCPDMPAFSTNSSCLMLTGVISGPLGGSLPQAIELYAICTVYDLSIYGLGRAKSGGSGSSGQSYTFPSDAIPSGTYIWASSELDEFSAFMGFAPTYANPAATILSGTEAVELYMEGHVIERYGEPSYNDSFGDPSWSFVNGWAYRVSNSTVGLSGYQAFGASEWTVKAGSLAAYSTNAAVSTNNAFPAGTYAPRLGWNPMKDCDVVTPCTCSVSTDHTAINCSTVPGAGAGHMWVVNIDGSASAASTTAYGSPFISSLSGLGAVNASTYGGEEITLSGYNFGPKDGAGASGNSSFLQSVTYGPGGSEYEAVGCRISVAHTEIVCRTVAGIGPSLSWIITVDGQASQASDSPKTNYAPPVLNGLSPFRVDTAGGSTHILNGTDLGMASTDSFLQVHLDGELLSVNGAGITTVYPAVSSRMYKIANPMYSDGTDGVRSPWIEALAIVMPALADEEHEKVLTVDTGNTDFGGAASITSNAAVALYKPPVLEQVQNIEGERIGTQATSDLVLLGRNFGSMGTIYYDGQAVDESTVTKWDDDELNLQVIGLSGNISVSVGNYHTDKLFFDDFSPVLFTSVATYMPDPNGYRTDARGDYSTASAVDDDNTANIGCGAQRNLTLAGLYFGSAVQDLSVLIGEGMWASECIIWPSSLAEITTFVSTDVVRSVTCQVPTGAGVGNVITFARGKKTAVETNETALLVIDYRPPSITRVWPQRVHTTGGSVTVSGINFGNEKARAGVTYGATKLKLEADSYTHTSMVMTVPPGDGPGQPLTLHVAGQETTVYASASAAAAAGATTTTSALGKLTLGYKYYAPNVTSVRVQGLRLGEPVPTVGATVLIIGSDFGLSGSMTTRMVRLLSKINDDNNDDTRRRALSSTDDDADDATMWEELPYIETSVLRSNHSDAMMLLGPGEGQNMLLVNVSGQVTLTPLNYAPPNLTMVEPPSVPTIGGANVTLHGVNFGVGVSFTLRLRGPGDDLSQEGCDHEWTEADLALSAGGSNPNGAIWQFAQDRLSFKAPAGQCDVAMNLTLEVAGQLSLQSLPFSYDLPAISMLSKDGKVPLGRDCKRTSDMACGLLTSGGYTVTVSGVNFGVEDQQLWFNEVQIANEDVEFMSHTECSFTVPAGAGPRVPVRVVVGSRTSPPAFFAYDPPYVTSFTPNEFDADEDLIEIYGRNFGTTLEDAGDVKVFIGNTSCSNVIINSYVASIWQTTRAGTPYLWCSIGHTTVGSKSVSIFVAGQNVTKDAPNSGVRGVCSSGFYGQEAFTAFTNSDSECEMPCTRADVNPRNPDGRRCTARYDDNADKFMLEAPFTDEDPECQEEWNCLVRTELRTGEVANCTLLTRTDEYCSVCPTGSACGDFTTLYSVEPIAEAGYWRTALKSGDDNHDGIFTCPDERKHRPYCWDFSPCLPTESCLGNNECLKGYTDVKCAQCCDWNYVKLEDGSKNPDCFDDETGEHFLYHRIYGKCEECPDNIKWLILGTFCFLIFCGLLGRRLQRKKVDLAIFSIGVDYFQVLAIFASTEVKWPASVMYLYRLFSVFNFSINLTPPECLLEVPYRTKWLVMQWFPSIIFAVVGVVYIYTYLYSMICSRHRTKRIKAVRSSMTAGSLLAMYILYLNISENTLQPLNCNTILSEDGERSKLQFMQAQPSEVCWQTGKYTLQMELLPYAWAFFVVYTIGYPLLVMRLLLHSKNRQKCINDQYLRCLGTGSKKETNKAYFDFRSKYATLYFKFKPRLYYWILIIIARKLCIVSFTLLFHVNATMQLAMILLVMFISYTLQVKCNPYLSRADYSDIVGEMDSEEYQALVGPYGACPQPSGIGYETLLNDSNNKASMLSHSSLAATYQKLRSGGMTRDDFNKSAAEFLKYAFNYNTVESVLLFCGILVCLFGIMFASEFTGPGEAMYERLGELTLAIICTSLAYYFSVVWVEVIAVMYPGLKISFVSGAVDQKKDQQILDEAGNVIGVKGDEDEEEEAMIALQTENMNEEERDQHRIRLAEVGIVYADTNPLMVRQFGSAAAAQAALAASASSEGQVGEETDRGPALLSLEKQIELQGTVSKLMDEIKGLKKKVALSGAGNAGATKPGSSSKSAADSATKKKLKSNFGGDVRPGDERKMRAGHNSDSGDRQSVSNPAANDTWQGTAQEKAPKKKLTAKKRITADSGDDDVVVDLDSTFGLGATKSASQVVRLGNAGSSSTSSEYFSNPMARSAMTKEGSRSGNSTLKPPVAAAATSGNGKTKNTLSAKKAAGLAGAEFDNEDLL